MTLIGAISMSLSIFVMLALVVLVVFQKRLVKALKNQISSLELVVQHGESRLELEQQRKRAVDRKYDRLEEQYRDIERENDFKDYDLKKMKKELAQYQDSARSPKPAKQVPRAIPSADSSIEDVPLVDDLADSVEVFSMNSKYPIILAPAPPLVLNLEDKDSNETD